MVFTAYIFQEDYDRLTSREVAHASQQHKGGSLFGQWTSTGNPVIHRALSFGESRSSRNEVARSLYEGFRVCYIGEWRAVQTYEQNEVQARKSLQPEREARFLVLDVSKAGIVPFLLNRHGQTSQEVRGALEKLPGKNPFNRSDVFRQSQAMVNYNNPPRHGNESEGAVAQHWRQDPPQNQVAVTEKSQWYSGDQGTSTLQNVVGKLQKIAQRENVEMSRDRVSQDITLSFTDKYHARKWEVKFPPGFPFDGAVVIEYQGTATRYRAPYTREHSILGNENVNTVITSVVSFIKNKTSIF